MADLRVRDAFLDFHRANPHIYHGIVRYAHQMRSHGRRRYSMWAVVNRVRWDHDLATGGRSAFKINNNFAAIYTRMVEHFHPDLVGFFGKRHMEGEHWLDPEFFARAMGRSDFDDPATGQFGLPLLVRRDGPDMTDLTGAGGRP